MKHTRFVTYWHSGKRIFLYAMILMVSLLVFSCTTDENTVTLVRKNKPVIRLLVDGNIMPLDKPSADVPRNERGDAMLVDRLGEQRRAVNELLKYVKQISGAELEVQAATPGSEGCYVGLGSSFPWLKQDLFDLGHEGFMMRTEGKNLYLLAHEPLGVRHAVTAFLKDQGCRWFFPGVEWEIVPQKKTITVSLDMRQKPSFSTGRTMWYGFGTYPKSSMDQEKWNYFNNMGSAAPVNIGHTWYGIDPEKDFAAHPGWFALVKGRRNNSKVCYSNPEVIEKMISHSLDLAAAGEKSISLTPADGLGYCECKLCREWAKGGEVKEERGSFFATRPDGELVCIVSETLFNAVNKVAAEVGKKFPDVVFGCYGYSAYSHPPSFRLEPNVFVQTTTEFRRTPLTLEDQINTWGARADQVGIRGYWSVYQWDWDNPYVGSFTPETIKKDLKFYNDHNVTAFNTEASNNWAARGLSYYVGSQLLWNVDADVKDLISDFYEKAFGPAALPMQRYYVRWYGSGVNVIHPDGAGSGEKKDENAVLDELADKNPRGSAASRESLTEAFRDLDEAAKLVTGMSEYRQRIDHLRMYASYLTLREKVREASGMGDAALVEAIKNETEFGGRLTNTNMIHTKPLLGKAFLRLFREYEQLLKALPEAQAEGEGWRKTGNPPAHDELEKIWQEGKQYLGI